MTPADREAVRRALHDALISVPDESFRTLEAAMGGSITEHGVTAMLDALLPPTEPPREEYSAEELACRGCMGPCGQCAPTLPGFVVEGTRE